MPVFHPTATTFPWPPLHVVAAGRRRSPPVATGHLGLVGLPIPSSAASLELRMGDRCVNNTDGLTAVPNGSKMDPK